MEYIQTGLTTSFFVNTNYFIEIYFSPEFYFSRYYYPGKRKNLKGKIFLHVFVTKRLHNKTSTDLKPHFNFDLKKNGFYSEYNCSDLAVHVRFFIHKNDAAKEKKIKIPLI